MIKYIFITAILLLTNCSEGGLWKTPVGTSVFDGLFGGGDEKKKEEVAPLVTYNFLQSNLPSVAGDNTSYPLHKIPVGEKVLDNMVPSSNFQPGKPLDGKQLEIYETVMATGQLDLSSVIGGGGEDIDLPKPGEVQFPFSDLNRDPMLVSPFAYIEAVPKSPPTEFFFDEVQKKPQFFD
jgi:hypothetical protein